MTSKHAAGWLSLPSSRPGKLSARLLVVSLVLVLANSLIVMPFTEGRTGLQAVQNVSNALVGSCVVASGVIGLFAVVARRERSWVVGVAILVLAVVMFLMVQDLASRG